MQLLEGLVCKEGDPCIWDNTQDCGSEASVKSPDAFLLRDPHKNMHDVAVPVARQRHLFNKCPKRPTIFYTMLSTEGKLRSVS